MTATATDSIPRIAARDLFMVLLVFDQSPATTLENIRLRVCVARKIQRRGTSQWSVARDTAGELVRLGMVEGSCYARNTRQYESIKTNRLCITAEGRELLQMFKNDRAAAYDLLFDRLVAQHLYLRQFIGVLNDGPLVAPIISSMRDHVSSKYGSNARLASDVGDGDFEIDALLKRLSERAQRPLLAEEEREIRAEVDRLVTDARSSALSDETTRFAKNMLNKLNDIIVPALFRNVGLGFDFRTHRTLWAMGEDFKIWSVLRSHPEYDGWVIYSTATTELSEDRSRLARLNFDHGLRQTRDGFLPRLFSAYQKLQNLKGSTFVPTWELRAVLCFHNQCQPSVFDRLFEESYGAAGEYRLQLEIQRQKPQHEQPVRAGNRNIGSVRVVKG